MNRGGVALPSLAVVTGDFSLYHDLVVRLKKRGISFASLSPKDSVPREVGVVIAGPEEANRIDFRPTIAARGDLEDVIDQALKALAGRTGAELVAVGVDPGRRIGVAALADGAVVASSAVTSVDEAVNRVRLFLQRHPAKRQVVRIGNGAPTVRDLLVQKLRNLDTPIEVVDERSTTEDVDLPDVRAAISIAATKGPRVERAPRIALSRGEVKDIQRLSRIRSRGRFTIPAPMARDVAMGLYSLDEAVRRYRRERQAAGALDLSREEE